MLRKFVVRASHLDDLVGLGSLTPAARFLDAAVPSGLNVLVSGGTQAGKTTLFPFSGVSALTMAAVTPRGLNRRQDSCSTWRTP